jgi:uncharacterized repeat protein (TIGR03803 family)
MLATKICRATRLAASVLAPLGGAHAAKLTTLHTFKGGAEGGYPSASVVPEAGSLYGTTAEGGPGGLGTVFRLNLATHAVTVLHSFAGGSDGGSPLSGLVVGRNEPSLGVSNARPVQYLYGVTYQGGTYGEGTLFRIDRRSGAEMVLHAFHGDGGSSPQGDLAYDGGGAPADAGSTPGSRHPVLYGTTTTGGASDYGTVFSIDVQTGAERVLYSFTGSGDGAYPIGGVTLAGGMLYGTTSVGGGSAGGALFKVNPVTGQETTLYSFVGNQAGQGGPLDRPIFAGGFLYGTTFGIVPEGQGSRCSGAGCGTIFKVNAATGAGSTLYTFLGGNDGANPAAGLTFARGMLYGTTFRGGQAWCNGVWGGCGTVFVADPLATAESPLHVFSSDTTTADLNGENPLARLAYHQGEFYGTTTGDDTHAGCVSGCGTVFKLTP